MRTADTTNCGLFFVTRTTTKVKKSKAPLIIIIILLLIVAIGVVVYIINGSGLFGGRNNSQSSGDATGGISNTTSSSGNNDNYGNNELFTPDKTKYEPSATIRIAVKDVTQTMLDNRAFIGIYKVGAANEDYMTYVYFENTGSSTVELTAPEEEGYYELRMYGEDFNYDSTHLQTVLFTVGNT